MGIRRSKRDRWISGVCGGIAHHYGWNPNVVRLVLVAVVLFTGVGAIPAIIIYALLAFILPEEEF
jgi:phage shock protein C